ncbi:DUF1918 domain-containing protein [Nocardia mikamii]|uniref:DUF1918 domain-containing protein n=1 Tax=Nocardia mikamii TaxID=508464 RepID=UPI00157D665E|nr:DUF1918 domain-containing protein [Nocardia mikamii]
MRVPAGGPGSPPHRCSFETAIVVLIAHTGCRSDCSAGAQLRHRGRLLDACEHRRPTGDTQPQGGHDRSGGEITEIRGAHGAPRQVVRFEDGHEGLIFPGPDCLIRPSRRRWSRARWAAAL